MTFSAASRFSASAFAGPAPPERLAQQVRRHVAQPTRHHVVEHAHPLEERDVLERPRDPLPCHLIGLHPGAGLASEPDLALLGYVEAGNHVEHGRFARAVRPDDRPDLALADVEGDVPDGLHAPEAKSDVAQVEYHVADLAPVLGDVSPGFGIHGVFLSGVKGRAPGPPL